MLLIECNKIKKYFGDRLILDVDHLKIYSEDRIGIVGRNGVGKTTLINILSQRLEPDEGQLKLYGIAGYISQLELPDRKNISGEIASKFSVEAVWDENMSGGEKTRFKLAEALDNHSMMVFADEPTSNVDMEGIELMKEKFGEYKGALIIISHDRSFLDKLCNQILEIENGKIKSYKGNYSDYKEIALIGPNGGGKSTLIKMIMDNEDHIRIAQGAKIGYFSQDMTILDENLTIIENVMESSIYPESFARLSLARLLFTEKAIYKKIDILSGGERVKVSFAKILLQDINLLILDEPTNYLDINALEVIEEAIKEYERTLLFVSHDRRFVDAVANQIMTIENQKIKIYTGNYKSYLSRNNKPMDQHKEEMENQVIILKNRLSEVIGRLSMPSKQDDIEALDKVYHEILDRLKRLKE